MTLAIVQARLGSSRLPGKMLRPLAGRPALEHTLERARAARSIDRLVVATTTLPLDDPLARLAEQLGVEVFRGHPDDVLDRYYQAAKMLEATRGETIVRLTGDCPMHDPAVIDRVIEEYQRARRGGNPAIEYASNISPPTFPGGLDVEVFSFSALEAAWGNASRDYEREHVTLYIRDHPELFPALNVGCPEGDLSALRWTLDVEEDAVVLDSLLSLSAAQHAAEFSYREGLRVLEGNSSLAAMNAAVGRNTPAIRSIVAEAFRERGRNSLIKSRELRRRAREVLTPPHTADLSGWPGPVIARADGCRAWDTDGDEYTDFRMGGGTVTFGHEASPPDSGRENWAGRLGGQVELAARLLDRFPGLTRAAFLGSLSDAVTVAADRAVRRTGRPRLAILDAHLLEAEIRGSWSLARLITGGISLTRARESSLEGDTSVGMVAESAAVIVEPAAEHGCAVHVPEAVSQLCAEMGTLLILNATPALLAGCHLELTQLPKGLELAVVTGAGLANGRPFGALLARDETFVASPASEAETIGRAGEASIAAALKNLSRLDELPERGRVCAVAARLWRGLQTIASDFRLFGYCELAHRPPFVIFRFCGSAPFRGAEMQFLFDDLMAARGLIWGPILTATPGHGDGDVERALEAAHSSARVLRALIDNRAVERVYAAELERLEISHGTELAAEPAWCGMGRVEAGLLGIPA